MKWDHGAVSPKAAKSVTAPATVGGERPRKRPLGKRPGRLGEALTRKSGDLPSRGIGRCAQPVTDPGGVSWKEALMVRETRHDSVGTFRPPLAQSGADDDTPPQT